MIKRICIYLMLLLLHVCCAHQKRLQVCAPPTAKEIIPPHNLSCGLETQTNFNAPAETIPNREIIPVAASTTSNIIIKKHTSVYLPKAGQDTGSTDKIKGKASNPTGNTSLGFGIVSYLLVGIVATIASEPTSDIISTVGIIILLMAASIALGVLALVLGKRGIKKAKLNGLEKSTSIAGLTLGLIYCLAGIAIITLPIVLFIFKVKPP